MIMASWFPLLQGLVFKDMYIKPQYILYSNAIVAKMWNNAPWNLEPWFCGLLLSACEDMDVKWCLRPGLPAEMTAAYPAAGAVNTNKWTSTLAFEHPCSHLQLVNSPTRPWARGFWGIWQAARPCSRLRDTLCGGKKDKLPPPWSSRG